jgi:iron(II)-dependent oxidoreductase
MIDARELARRLLDARARTLALVEDLRDAELVVPRLDTVNPFLWELGHVAWFQEYWTLRHRHGRRSFLQECDALYDSAAVAHSTRWDLPLPSRADTLVYLQRVLECVLERLESTALTPECSYFYELAIFHEDMHTEALTYTRQTLGLPEPRYARPVEEGGGPLLGDIEHEGGIWSLGAQPNTGFVFDNETPACTVTVRPFRISRAAVTQAEFAAFVDDHGYAREALWSSAGWQWRDASSADAPVYWRREGSAWWRRHFDRWVRLEQDRPMIHVNWFEAEAFCRWSRRRLPSEAEWEFAASYSKSGKRSYPWGEDAGDEDQAHLDGSSLACRDVGALPKGDSDCGVRQLLGNVWEWTASIFEPYPGFVAGPYKEYSQPWFGTHRVLRGGCFATRRRLIRSTWRNFFLPERRDIFAGFRTAAR